RLYFFLLQPQLSRNHPPRFSPRRATATSFQFRGANWVHPCLQNSLDKSSLVRKLYHAIPFVVLQTASSFRYAISPLEAFGFSLHREAAGFLERAEKTPKQQSGQQPRSE